MKQFVSQGVIIHVGQNAKDNDMVVANAQPYHWWFHLSDLPSAHVILCDHDKNVLDRDIMHDCALLVCYHSKKAIGEMKRVSVSYCKVSNLTKVGCRCVGEQKPIQTPRMLSVKWRSKVACERISNVFETTVI